MSYISLHCNAWTKIINYFKDIREQDNIFKCNFFITYQPKNVKLDLFRPKPINYCKCNFQLLKNCIRATLGPLVGVWFRSRGFVCVGHLFVTSDLRWKPLSYLRLKPLSVENTWNLDLHVNHCLCRTVFFKDKCSFKTIPLPILYHEFKSTPWVLFIP